MLSLKDFDTVGLSENPIEFEVTDIEGNGTGFFISVIGQQSETFTKQAMALAKQYELDKAAADPVAFVESDASKDFTNNLVAARIVGWRGIKEKFSKEDALTLVKRNPRVFDLVLEKSNKIANFTKL